MQMFETLKLKPHPRNNEFFDDIMGDNWNEFLKSVKSSGVIEPIVITQEYVIVSGHQRARACKELGIAEVPCEVKIYDNEDQVIKDMLETNLRQRGIGNTNSIKFAKCIAELERIYGIKNGGDRKSDGNNFVLKTQGDLAEEIGIDQRQLQNYKKLLTLIPEFQDLIEKGEMSPTIGYKVLSKLSKEEQQKLILDFGGEYIAGLTQKKVEDLSEKVKQLASELDNEKAKPISDEALKKIHDSENKIKSLETEVANKDAEIKTKTKALSDVKAKIDEFKNKPPEEKIPEDYEDLKAKISSLEEETKKLKEEKDKANLELANLSRAQIQLKDIYKVRDFLGYYVRDIMGGVAKLELLMGDIDNLQDPKITECLSSASDKLMEAKERVDMLNKNKGVIEVVE